MILEMFLLLFPGILASIFYGRIERGKRNKYSYFENFAVFTLYIYLFNNIIIYLRGWRDFSIQTIGILAQVKYAIVSIILAIVFPFFWHSGKQILKKYNMIEPRENIKLINEREHNSINEQQIPPQD